MGLHATTSPTQQDAPDPLVAWQKKLRTDPGQDGMQGAARNPYRVRSGVLRWILVTQKPTRPCRIDARRTGSCRIIPSPRPNWSPFPPCLRLAASALSTSTMSEWGWATVRCTGSQILDEPRGRVKNAWRRCVNATGPVTLGDLMREGKLLWVYCRKCCRERDVDPVTIPLPPEVPVPEVGSRMTRSACGSREVETKPELYPGGIEAMRRRRREI